MSRHAASWALALAFAPGCFGWNTQLPAATLGYGNKELVLVGQAATPGAGGAAGWGLRFRIGTSDRRDFVAGVSAEARCADANPLDCGGGAASLWRTEIGLQSAIVQTRRFFLSHGEGVSLGLVPSWSGNGLSLGVAAWITLGVRPSDHLEIYLSGRLLGDPAAVIGARGRFSRAVISAEAGLVALRTFNAGQWPNGNTYPAAGLSLAIGLADDIRWQPRSADGAVRMVVQRRPRDGSPLAHQAFRLPNGLTAVFREDHTYPVAAVAVRYRVGSAQDPAGKKGLAHLVEHLMFEGSAHARSGHGSYLDAVGAFRANASTTETWTEYWQLVPAAALETVLWAEADRMGYLSDALDDRAIGRARDAVRNERLEKVESQPYGRMQEILVALLFAPGHPYAVSAAGEESDIQAASRSDAERFLDRWYVPANATVAIVGDFETDRAKTWVQRYFGTLDKRPPPPREPIPEAQLERAMVVDHDERLGTLPAIAVGWLTPAYFREGDAAGDVLAYALASTTGGRLHRRLVVEDRTAVQVAARQASRPGQSFFSIAVVGREGTSADELLRGVDQVLDEVRKNGLTAEELTRAVARFTVDVSPRRSVAPHAAATAELLLHYFHHLGTGDGAKLDLDRYRRLSREEVRRFASEHLNPGRRVVIRARPDAAGLAGGG